MNGAVRAIACVTALACAAASGAAASLEEAVATRLARAAVMQTRAVPNPTLDDYRLTALSLGEAIELDPDADELLRLQIEAWGAADEDDRALDATRRLARLAPGDTVTQLAALSARVRELQRIEDRLTMYDRLLGSAGGSLDDSVRSRLAFDAALLHRELGDDDEFVRLLRLAMNLDQTNKQAALLASALFFERVEDPASRCEMHVQLLLADPLDPQSHLSLARELLVHGAYAGAQRFLENALTLRAKRGLAMTDELQDMRHTVRWGLSDAGSMLAQLDEQEAARRFAVDVQRNAAEKAGEDPSAIPDANTHPVENRLRALLAAAVNRTSEASAHYARYRSSMEESIVRAAEMGRITRDQIPELERRVMVDRIRVRAWAGVDLQQTQSDLKELITRSEGALREDARARYRGLIAAHNGDRASARRLLEPLGDDDLLAQVGLGIAAENDGAPREAAGIYARVLRASPGTAEALWARDRLQGILGTRVNPTDLARRLDAIAQQAPRALERFIDDPSEYLALSVDLAPDALDPMTKLSARVRLHNGGVFPLAIGVGSPIEPRVLVAPKFNVRGAPSVAMAGPEFASLARKIRLLPGESVSADVRLDLGAMGTLVDATSPLAASLRCQAINAYIHSDERGVYRASPFGLKSGSNVVWRRPERPSPEFADILERVTSLSGEEFYAALAESQWFFAKNTPEDDTGELSGQRVELAEALASRYPTLSEMEQAYALLCMPGSWQVAEAAAVDEAARAAEPTPLTTLILLLTRVSEPDDPSLAIGLASGDAVVREVAEIKELRMKIREGMRRLEERNATPDESDPFR